MSERDCRPDGAREKRLQGVWAAKLHEELELCQAPGLRGKTRPSTLKSYVTICRRWRLWLWEAKGERPRAGR